MTHTQPELRTFAHRVSAAANSHDIDRVVGCFTEDYRNETPVHPSRGFVGREQVRRNWTRIFAAVPTSGPPCCGPTRSATRCGRSGR